MLTRICALLLFLCLIPACGQQSGKSQKDEFMQGSMADKGKFTTYTSEGMNICFQYPVSWQKKEIENLKNNYQQIHLVGPRRGETGFPVSLTIQAFSRSKSLKNEIGNYISQKRRLKDFNLLEHSIDLWAAELAEVIEFTYLVTLPFYAADTQKVIVREKTIFFKKGEKLFKIRYFVEQERFTEFLNVLKEFRKSLIFLG